jgi:hypothetical protein
MQGWKQPNIAMAEIINEPRVEIRGKAGVVEEVRSPNSEDEGKQSGRAIKTRGGGKRRDGCCDPQHIRGVDQIGMPVI